MSPRKSAARLIAGLAAAAILLSSCSDVDGQVVLIPAPTATPAISEQLVRFYEQQVTWVDCGDAQCTKVAVPMDYDDPNGQSIDLAVVRVPASDSAIGALFVNPGGPGGSGFDYAKVSRQLLGEGISAHYDIVGVDPRGVGKSDPVVCLSDQQRDDLVASESDPQTRQELAALTQQARVPAKGCGRFADPRYLYMGTASAARDLDIVRAVVQDESFNYLGKSYGTLLGSTYAALFPERVGRMVLDGVLPADATLREITRTQAVAFEEAVAHFAADCVTEDDCPFEGDAASAVIQVREFLRSLKARPLAVGDRQLNQTLASSAVLSFLYFPATDYPRLRVALGRAVNDRDGAPLLSLLDERSGRQPGGTYRDNSLEAFYSVTCADRQVRDTKNQVRALARELQQSAPTFGPGLAWGTLPCTFWPAAPVTRSALDTEATAARILILATTHDPATPAQWAQELATQLPSAALLTWGAHNHTAYQEGSSCIDDAVDAYLLRGSMPLANANCSV